jgi:aarF domain-containing kinase
MMRVVAGRPATALTRRPCQQVGSKFRAFSRSARPSFRQRSDVRPYPLQDSRVLLYRALSTAALNVNGSWLTLRPATPTKATASLPTVLAHSSTTLSTPSYEVTEFLRRTVQRIRSFLQSIWDFLTLSVRGVEVVGRLSPLLLLTPAAMAVHPWLSANDNRLSDFSWWYFTSSVQSLGPVFVKLCQWVATRPDIFPPHVCERLSCLHDQGLPHAYRFTEQMLREAFGDYEAAGLYMDAHEVIGCGAAAQVYRARLQTASGTSRPVAVKVLHPRFHELVARDFWFMREVAGWLHALPVERLHMLNLPRVASNFGTLLEAQADLRLEGDHLRTFRHNFYGDAHKEHDGDSAITFPRPVDGWSARNILVEDLIDNATPIAEYLHDSSAEGIAIRKELAGPLLRAFLKMVFLDNFVHCDLHPGNVLVQTHQVSARATHNWWQRLFFLTSQGSKAASSSAEEEDMVTKRTIVFLDAGLTTSLSPVDQRNLLDLFRAVILNKGEEAGRLMVERAKHERCSQTPGGIEAFSEGIGALVAEFHGNRQQGLTLGAVRIGSLLSRVLDLCRVHGVEIDPAMASIVVSTLVLEGLGRSLEPSMNLIDFAIPFVLGRGRV